MSTSNRLQFGAFMAPFHRVGENPTLALERDLELIQWLDVLGYDEIYVGAPVGKLLHPLNCS